jgi:ArsR family transcriptional regulator, arsenate/arsenite/antimonite-responsive transcriptional repressor
MEKWLKLFKALGDDKRLKILALLYKHGFCVGALAKILDISDAAVSQHIRILRDVGMLKGEKRGGYTFYEVNSELLSSLALDIGAYLDNKPDRKECCQYMTGEHQYCDIYIQQKSKK